MQRVTYFFRNSRPGNFSIEELFNTIIDFVPDEKRKIVSSHLSSGLVNRLKICIEGKKYQGDINHITGDIHFLALALSKEKTVLTIHDCRHIQKIRSIKDFIYWLFWFYLPIKNVKAVTVISEATKAELLKIVKIDANKIHVIHNCLFPIFKYVPKEFNKSYPTILQIGTSDNKNLKKLIPALKGISCKLVIIGRINEEISSSLIENKIQYENKYSLSQQELFEEYQKADIVSFVSTYEGFGLPIIEANAVGRAVLSSNISSMPEVAGDAAILVNPHSVEEIKMGILELINNDAKREMLIEKGFENIKRFQPEVIASQYSELYHKIRK